MAKFLPGQSGNPLGARLHNPELRAIRKLTNEQVAEIGNLLLQDHSYDRLKEIMQKRDESPLKIMMAGIILRAIDEADVNIFTKLMDRFVGKMPTKIQAQHLHAVEQIQEISEMTHDELIEAIENAIDTIKVERKTITLEKEGKPNGNQ